MLDTPTTHDLSHSSEPTGAEPIFKPIATAPAMTADEALKILARECNDLADQEHACHKEQGGMDENDPRFDELTGKAGALDNELTARWAQAMVVRPETLAGLAAKARIAYSMHHWLEGCIVQEAEPLLLSIAEDAVRLNGDAPEQLWAAQDAVVIRAAAKVRRLARMELRAYRKLSELEDKVDAVMAPRPRGSDATEAANAAYQAELDAIGGVLAYKLNDPIIVEAHKRAFEASKTARAPFDAARSAWEAERERLMQEIGATAVQERVDRLIDRVGRAGMRLVGMKPTTVAGCMALAQAAEAAAETGLGSCGGWTNALYQAVVHATGHLQTKPVGLPPQSDVALLSFRSPFETAWKAESRARAGLKDSGSDEDYAAYDHAADRVEEAIQNIESFPASSLEGLKLKAAALSAIYPGEEITSEHLTGDAARNTPDIRLILQIIRDLRAMVEEPSVSLPVQASAAVETFEQAA